MKMGLSFNTRTRKWMLENLALGVKNYWFTFIADSGSALFFLLWEFHGRRTGPFTVAAACLAGFFLWGLSEYIVHRWMYHQENGIYGDGHRIHHEAERTLIAMPWFMTTLFVFGLWYFFAVLLGVHFFSGILAGWLAGFVWYSLVHHSHHHWNVASPWMRKLKAYHRIHHQMPGYNYGVTLRFWDDVFGTRLQKPARNPYSELMPSSVAETEPVAAAATADY